MPEIKPLVWKKDVQTFPAHPICRTHAEQHKPAQLAPFPSTRLCAVDKCEYHASYLAIDA